MFVRTLSLLARLLPYALDHDAYPIDPALSVSAAVDVASVVSDNGPLPFAVDPELSTARLLLRWSYEESRHTSMNKDGTTLVGMGGALGAMQILPSTASMFRTTPRRLASRIESYRVGLAVFKAGAHKCGSIRGALRAYASGNCDWADDLVEYRCSEAGLPCEESPLK